MIRESCSLIGQITKIHGIDGFLMVRVNGDYADDIEPGEPLFVELDGVLVPFFIEEVEAFPDRALVKLEFITNPNEAKKITGCKVYLENSLLKNESAVNIDDPGIFEGYSMSDKNSGFEGTIIEYIDNPQNPLFLAGNSKIQFLIPVHPDFILRIDKKGKKIVFDLPEGMIGFQESVVKQ